MSLRSLLRLPLVPRLVVFPIPSLVPLAIFHRPPSIDIDYSDRWDRNHRPLPLPQHRPDVNVAGNKCKRKPSQPRASTFQP